MKKRTLTLLLAVAIVFSTMCALPMTASATESGTCGENLTWTLDDNGTLTISGTGEMESHNSSSDYPWQDFQNKIVTVKIDEGVTSIGGLAFYGCSFLTSITIPGSVTSIESSAFKYCTSLTSIEVQNDNTAYTSIDGFLFNKDKTSLLRYPAGKAETNYTISDSVTSIGDDAFSDCTSLTSITIPDNVTDIGNYAFKSCSSLTEITIPDNVTSISKCAFYDCSSLTSVSIPGSVTSIEYGAFKACTSLTSVTIPNSVERIGEEAFCDCSSLTSVSIPDSVTSIEIEAFRFCVSLKSITIPDSVTSIGDDAFSDCTSLTNIQVQTENTAYTSIDGVLFTKDKTELLCYPAGKAETNYTIPDSVTSINAAAFRVCTSLTSVSIPDSVTSIDLVAFYGCTSLKSVIIPNSVTRIGEWTFSRCSSLTSVTIPDSVTSIGYHAFYSCDKCKIYGNAGSYAQTYANENNIPFVIISPVNNNFSDVVPGEWYVSAVEYAVDNGLFFGVSDTEFAPDVAMNRAMLVTVLWRLEGKPTVSAENKFTDVPADEWYTDAVIWASENGVVFGTGDGKFSPEDSITREQMAAILYRYAQKKGYDVTASTDLGTFPDGASASPYARDALSWACGSGLIFGSDGKLLPQDGATRAQVAAILMRYTEKVVQ